MRRRGKQVALALALVLGAAAVAGAAWLGYALAVPFTVRPVGDGFVEIARGMPTRSIARLLEQRGVVRSARAFEALARWRGETLKAGEYQFRGRLNAIAVHRAIVDGRVFTRDLLVPEGLTIFDVADLVEQNEFAPRDEFLAAAGDAALIADLAPGAKDLEGFLFPARYAFPRRISAGEIAAAMVAKFRTEWAALPAAGEGAAKLSPLEVVTLASLIEKETSLAEERPLVAGVFHNRLQRGMPLQCDPTVIYALRLAGRYRGTLLIADLAFDSPYNTYRHRGLPPGPIASPGAASLRAALAPPETDYLYFVSDAQGGHFFARTLAEHNQNVARYRRLQAEAAAGRGAPRESAPAKNGPARGEP
jgi:UPF0755 protein